MIDWGDVLVIVLAAVGMVIVAMQGPSLAGKDERK